MAKKNIQTQQSNIFRFEDFHKRWNIQLNEKDRWSNFKNRVLNSFLSSSKIETEFLLGNGKEQDFFTVLGIHRKTSDLSDVIAKNFGKNKSDVYEYFYTTTDIKKFILGIEVVFLLPSITEKNKELFLKDIQEIIMITNVPLEIKKTKTDILFYPAGAKLLDEKIINDNLDWLSNYSKSYDAFVNSLNKIGKKGEERDTVDNLRLSLELLIKDILQNNKSLENQKDTIGIFLKERNVSKEISNLFWTVLDFYSKYQNNKAKHDYNVSSKEVEFILYLTGTLMRFLLTISSN